MGPWDLFFMSDLNTPYTPIYMRARKLKTFSEGWDHGTAEPFFTSAFYTPYIHPITHASQKTEILFEGGVGRWDCGTFSLCPILTPHIHPYTCEPEN